MWLCERMRALLVGTAQRCNDREEINFARTVNNLLAVRTLGKRLDSICEVLSPLL